MRCKIGFGTGILKVGDEGLRSVGVKWKYEDLWLLCRVIICKYCLKVSIIWMLEDFEVCLGLN